METWHPFCIHLPIGLVLVWPWIDAAGALLSRDDVSKVGLALLVASVPASLLATITGERAYEAAIEAGASAEVLNTHSDNAELLPWALLITLAVRFFGARKFQRRGQWAAVILGFLLIGLVVSIGDSGGALVFEHGIGVQTGR